MGKDETGKLKHSNLKKTKHKYFYASPSGVLTYRKRHNGKPIKITTGTDKISEAKKVVDEELPKILGLDAHAAKMKRLGIINQPVEDIWKACVDERRAIVAEATLVKYDVAWRNHIEPFWGTKHVSDLTEQNVRAWESWFMTNKPGRVFFNTGKYFGMLLRFAHKRGHIQKALEVTDLDKYISAIAKKEKVWRVYTEQEIQRMLEVKEIPIARYGVMFGAFMGFRISEFLGIQWKRVEFKNSSIEVWSKNKYWRKVPMPAMVRTEMSLLRDSQSGAKLIFPMATNNEKPMSKQLFYKEWAKLKKKAEIVGRARVHDLRHTFATKTVRDNWPPAIACTLLDMSLKEYMDTYVHITLGDMASLMQKSFGGEA